MSLRVRLLAGIVVLVTKLTLVRPSIPLRPAFEREEWVALLRAVVPYAAAIAIGTLYLRSTIILMLLVGGSNARRLPKASPRLDERSGPTGPSAGLADAASPLWPIQPN